MLIRCAQIALTMLDQYAYSRAHARTHADQKEINTESNTEEERKKTSIYFSSINVI